MLCLRECSQGLGLGLRARLGQDAVGGRFGASRAQLTSIEAHMGGIYGLHEICDRREAESDPEASKFFASIYRFWNKFKTVISLDLLNLSFPITGLACGFFRRFPWLKLISISLVLDTQWISII